MDTCRRCKKEIDFEHDGCASKCEYCSNCILKKLKNEESSGNRKQKRCFCGKYASQKSVKERIKSMKKSGSSKVQTKPQRVLKKDKKARASKGKGLCQQADGRGQPQAHSGKGRQTWNIWEKISCFLENDRIIIRILVIIYIINLFMKFLSLQEVFPRYNSLLISWQSFKLLARILDYRLSIYLFPRLEYHFPKLVQNTNKVGFPLYGAVVYLRVYLDFPNY